MMQTDTAAGLSLRSKPGMFNERGHLAPSGGESVKTIDLGPTSATIIETNAGGLSYRHRCDKSAGSALIDYWIPVSGSLSLNQNGKSAEAVNEEFITALRKDPYDLSTGGPAKLVLISVPNERLHIDPCGLDALAARHSNASEAGVVAVTTQISTFTEFLADLAPGTTVKYGYHLVEMVTILTQEMFAHCKIYQDQVREQTLLRMQAWARSRLSDPNLSIAAIARAHKVSVRYVQKLFKEHGESPNRWIRNERLAGCLNDLRDPRNAELTIAMVARRWGFLNCSYFTRVFRERYGFTPAVCRPA